MKLELKNIQGVRQSADFLVGEPELNILLCVCGVCVVSVCVCGVRCPLDGCDAPIGQKGKITVQ